MCAVHFLPAFPTGSVYFVDWQNTCAYFYRINRIELKSVQRMAGVEQMQCFENERARSFYWLYLLLGSLLELFLMLHT